MCARSDFTRNAAKQFDSQCVVEEHRKMKCSRKIFFNNLLINICKITHAAAAASGRCVVVYQQRSCARWKKRALTYLVLEPSDKVDIFCVFVFGAVRLTHGRGFAMLFVRARKYLISCVCATHTHTWFSPRSRVRAQFNFLGVCVCVFVISSYTLNVKRAIHKIYTQQEACDKLRVIITLEKIIRAHREMHTLEYMEKKYKNTNSRNIFKHLFNARALTLCTCTCKQILKQTYARQEEKKHYVYNMHMYISKYILIYICILQVYSSCHIS